MGRRTFGKGSAQGVFETPPGGVRITTARWFTPAGRSIDMPRVHDLSPEEGPPTHKTDAGRVIIGGGGIVPDTAIGDTLLTPGEQALEDALGPRVIRFRDAMVDVAMAVRSRGTIDRIDFAVTQAMLDELLAAMRARGLRVDRATLNGATPLVSRLLAREIARYVFGPQGEAERAIRDDRVIQAAARLVGEARTPSELLGRVATRGDAQNAK